MPIDRTKSFQRFQAEGSLMKAFFNLERQGKENKGPLKMPNLLLAFRWFLQSGFCCFLSPTFRKRKNYLSLFSKKRNFLITEKSFLVHPLLHQWRYDGETWNIREYMRRGKALADFILFMQREMSFGGEPPVEIETFQRSISIGKLC